MAGNSLIGGDRHGSAAGDAAPTSPTLNAWARRLALLLCLGLVIALPVAWVGSQYQGRDINSALSFKVNDAWCDLGYSPTSFGAHCFGDYSQALVAAKLDFQLLDAPVLMTQHLINAIGWSESQTYSSLYPPVSQFPHVTAALLADSSGQREGAFYTYMLLLALAVLSPALWVAYRWRRSPFALVPLILIGVAATPVFAVLDRGNSAGFAVPFLLAFAIFLGREPRWASPAAVVGAALVRPQFVLLALALLAVRQWRRAAAAVAAFASITVASFALTPGGFSSALGEWYARVSSLASVGFGSVASDTPANPSISRSIAATASVLSDAPASLGSAGAWLANVVLDNPLIPVAVLVALVAWVFCLAPPGAVPRSVAVVLPLAIASLAPGFTPAYYLLFAVVLGALVLNYSGSDGEQFIEHHASRWHQVWGWFVVIAVALSLTPITLAGDTPSGSLVPRNSLILENIGRLWLAVILVGLAVAIARTVVARRSPPA